MLRSLRRKFIAISMCSTALVLAAIIAGINITNYVNVCNSADGRIELISGNGGIFPKWDGFPEEFDRDFSPFRRPGMSMEAPFDTRYFTVTVRADGTVDQIDTGRIAAISTADASRYAATLFARNAKTGFIDCYRYRAVPDTANPDESTVMYIFLNCERELATFRAFLFASISVSLLGLLLVFLLVVFFSGRAVKPVAESYEKQKRFITDASHEIKTPLTIIDANTEVIEMTGGENQWTKSTRNQIARLTALTEKLVFLSRMDEDSSKLIMSEFNFSDAVLDTAGAFKAVADSREKTLILDVAPDIKIKGDETTLRQLVSLLLDNAVKYSAPGSEIRLTLRLSGKNRQLTVHNKTSPISPGRHDELFERFYRPDESRNSQTGGYGIGLSQAQAIVNAHKGKITATSDGSSLTFTVLL